jgi:hypothetical protein
MWPQPHVRAANLNPYPFFPFNPRWGQELPLLEFETFCALLRLAWVSPRPCFLPPDPAVLSKMIEPYRMKGGAVLTERVMRFFTIHSETGLLYFPPQAKALERLVSGENMYALLWEEM